MQPSNSQTTNWKQIKGQQFKGCNYIKAVQFMQPCYSQTLSKAIDAVEYQGHLHLKYLYQGSSSYFSNYKKLLIIGYYSPKNLIESDYQESQSQSQQQSESQRSLNKLIKHRQEKIRVVEMSEFKQLHLKQIKNVYLESIMDYDIEKDQYYNQQKQILIVYQDNSKLLKTQKFLKCLSQNILDQRADSDYCQQFKRLIAPRNINTFKINQNQAFIWYIGCKFNFSKLENILQENIQDCKLYYAADILSLPVPVKQQDFQMLKSGFNKIITDVNVNNNLRTEIDQNFSEIDQKLNKVFYKFKFNDTELAIKCFRYLQQSDYNAMKYVQFINEENMYMYFQCHQSQEHKIEQTKKILKDYRIQSIHLSNISNQKGETLSKYKIFQNGEIIRNTIGKKYSQYKSQILPPYFPSLEISITSANYQCDNIFEKISQFSYQSKENKVFIKFQNIQQSISFFEYLFENDPQNRFRRQFIKQ